MSDLFHLTSWCQGPPIPAFFKLSNTPLSIYCNLQYIHLYAYGLLGCSHSLAVVNYAVIHISIQASMYMMSLIFRKIPKRGTVGSVRISILICLRNLHIIFHSGCINLHSHQQYRNISFASLFIFIFLSR